MGIAMDEEFEEKQEKANKSTKAKIKGAAKVKDWQWK